MITPELLTKAKLCDIGAANKWAPLLDAAAQEFGIDTPERVVGWLAQCAHESLNFRFLEENLNYSKEGLLSTFPKYFTPIQAGVFARNPERIGNRVYANRNGNGTEASGEGFKYRGRGILQLTGKSNYRAYAQAVGMPEIVSNPEILLQPEHAARSAAWFWGVHGLNELADRKNIEQMTRVVNGGTNGLSHRKELYSQLSSVMLA